jgi:hypothetical protein
MTVQEENARIYNGLKAAWDTVERKKNMEDLEWVEVARSWQDIWDPQHGGGLVSDEDHYTTFVNSNPGWDYTWFPADIKRPNTTDDVIVRFEDDRSGNDTHYFVYFEANDDGSFWLINKISIDDRPTVFGS